MFEGLRLMEESARQAFLQEACVEMEDGRDSSGALIDWMAGLVGCQGKAEPEVEFAVLQWAASMLKLENTNTLSTDELEAAVRRKIADDSQDFLYPFMEVGSAVTYIGPQKVMGPKLELLESATATLIPSHSARDRLRQSWLARGAKIMEMQGTLQAHTLLGWLEEPIGILKHGSETTRASVIAMSVAVALSDGRFEIEEEQFVEGLAKEFGFSTEKLNEIKKQVGDAFWKHLSALGGGVYKSRSTEEELSLNLRAAQLALESCGSLASFSEVVERGFVGSLHSSMSTGSGLAQRLKRLGKTPIKFSLGFATGMLCFIRDRWNADEHETLMRLVMSSIYQQHLHATADHAEISEEDLDSYELTSHVNNPADVLAETIVGHDKVEPVKPISLERTKFERP